jgi:hypothetical protein
VPPVLKRAALRADPGRVLQALVDFIDGIPVYTGLLLISPIGWLPLLVVHELGHAAAALWRTDGPVFVRIGTKQRRWSLRSTRLTMQAGPNELPLTGGFCRHSAAGLTPGEAAIIALAGPAASFAGACVTWLMWAHTGGLVRGLLSVETVGGILVAVLNVLPLTVTASRFRPGPVIRLDGRIALDALRTGNARVGLYVVPPRAPDPGVARRAAESESRRLTSIPPPGHR